MTSQTDLILTTSAASPFQIIGLFAEKFSIKNADVLVRDFTKALNEGLARQTSTDEGDDQERLKLIERLTKWQELVLSPRFYASTIRYFDRLARNTPMASPLPASPRRSTRVHNVKQEVEGNTFVSESDLQIDGIFLSNDNETVGQRIKEAALKLDPSVLAPDFKRVHERRSFVLGASSILDLVDRSPESQLFQVFQDKGERDELLNMFSHLDVRNTATVPEPEELLAHWDACIFHATREGLISARSYLLREISACTPEFMNELWLLLIMIDALINNPSVFSRKVDVTEGDLLSILWRPLVSRLFYQRQAETNVRVKSGESTRAASNASKRTFYEDNNAIAFKIDSRVLLDDVHKGEIDLAAIEVAPNCQEAKIFSDGAKVLREAKEIVDGLVQIFPDNNDLLQNAVGYGMQISNLRTIIFSLHLVAPRLYVAWPQYRVGLPSSIGSLGDFREVIVALNWFRHVIQRTSTRVKAVLSLKATIDNMYGYNNSSASLGQQKWVSQTWYTPTKSSKIRPIHNLMAIPFPLLTIPRAQPETTSTRELHSDAVYDENGWAVVKVGGELKFFNKDTLKYLNERGGKRPKLE
ncbi:hypothetical protein BGX27_010538 [Mortierella sp. AM989]|nr:hypothetical protein BGX27_010538 [Mortierella sp. AM989]